MSIPTLEDCRRLARAYLEHENDDDAMERLWEAVEQLSTEDRDVFMEWFLPLAEETIEQERREVERAIVSVEALRAMGGGSAEA